MGTSRTTAPKAGLSPRSLGRIAGVCQLLEAITATFGQVIILGRFVVTGNATATAANILGHERLYWAGFSSSAIAAIFHLAWAFLMYDLLKPVNRRVAQFAMLVMLMGIAMQAVTALFYIAPLVLLKGGSSLGALTTEQLQAVAAASLKLGSYAFDIHVAYFGLWCVLTGYLIFKSTFLPRILGILLAISGFGWLLYFSPPFAVPLFSFIGVLSAIGEIPVELWLIIKSVNEQRWKEQASAASL